MSLTKVFKVILSADDGKVEGTDTSYAPATGTATTNGATIAVTRSLVGSDYTVGVGLLRFDTASIPDDADIISAKLRLYVTATGDTDSRSLSAEWYATSNWPIAANDYTSTAASDAHTGTTIASLTTSAYNELTLTALTNISKTGYTGLRLHISGTAPTGANSVTFNGLDNDVLTPELSVTYAIGKTIDDMLTEVDDLLVPNSLTDAQKVNFLNAIEREVYRKVWFPNKRYTAHTFANVDTYQLPDDCQPDRIARVFMLEDRRVIGLDEMQVYIGSTVTDDLTIYDLDDDDDIDEDDKTILHDRGDEFVYAEGIETEYEYAAYVNENTHGYRYTIVDDHKVRLYPIPDTNSGSISAISVTAGGSSFTSAPTVVITGDGEDTTATATVSGGAVTAITLTNKGKSHSFPPRITFTGGGGSGATAAASLNSVKLVIEYSPKPTKFTTSNLNAIPIAPGDFHQFYIWKLASMVAKTQKDVELANNFDADAREVEAKMIRDFSAGADVSFQARIRW